jgi:hypothetical protein
MSEPELGPLKEYVGYIWVADTPGKRISVWARSAEEASRLVEAEYGEGHPYSIRNERDANKPRRGDPCED